MRLLILIFAVLGSVGCGQSFQAATAVAPTVPSSTSVVTSTSTESSTTGSSTSGSTESGSSTGISSSGGSTSGSSSSSGSTTPSTVSAAPALVCSPGSKQGCGVANGSGIQVCNDSGSAWGSCIMTACNGGFVSLNGSCVSTTCNIWDINSLRDCVNRRSTVQVFNLINDLHCWGGDCCAADGSSAMLNIWGVSGAQVAGNGHWIHRHGGHRTCPAMDLTRSSSIVVQNLNLNEDEGVGPCSPDENCPSTVKVFDASWLNFQNVNIYHAKSTAVYLWHVDGFTFNESTISNAGVIGFYAGNGVYQNGMSSNHISITNSVFSRVRTNAIAFQGVWGGADGDNRIENNILNGNHYQGQWWNEFGRINGGQIYLPTASFVSISNNLIANGRCDDCHDQRVWGFELAGEGLLYHVSMYANRIYNGYGSAFFKNRDGALDSSVMLWWNGVLGMTNFVLEGQGYSDNLPGASYAWADNVIGDLTPSLNHYGFADYAIYRLNYNGFHEEANTVDERPGATFEGIFRLSMSPRVGGPTRPIYRCFINGSTTQDFPSTSRDCEGQTFHSILGYSWESTSGAWPIYRCRKDGDHFVSWDGNCEGQIFEGQLGYAFP